MDELLSSEIAEEHRANAEIFLADVAGIDENGFTLTFDGQTVATQKKYCRIEGSGALTVGDRVMVVKNSGTYIILGKITTENGGSSSKGSDSTVANIITASLGFSMSAATYTWDGDISMLYVKAYVITAVTTATWKQVGTVVAGRRPASNVAVIESMGRGARLSANGKLEVYGTYAYRDNLEFSVMYFTS